MLITFTTRAYADITLFREVALQLLELMGHSGSVPGSLLAADIPTALTTLRAGLASQPQAAPPDPTEDSADEDDEQPEPVALQRRAWPLIQLLEAAERQGKDVMWRESGG